MNGSVVDWIAVVSRPPNPGSLGVCSLDNMKYTKLFAGKLKIFNVKFVESLSYHFGILISDVLILCCCGPVTSDKNQLKKL